ncbi:hypothetical protein BDP27DRAFT_1422197 [Rhodocollybia butyracea]|uniref:DUF6532 domain-containing protein n=1 Tax=Rhodocollybia butyracea TaxID=206335 RepID=A0A9P5U5U2_9AGAR|nr:hypothetical protein BDP27DRAFT_1422197 [Rhodocollybia butyracea]
MPAAPTTRSGRKSAVDNSQPENQTGDPEKPAPRRELRARKRKNGAATDKESVDQTAQPPEKRARKQPKATTTIGTPQASQQKTSTTNPALKPVPNARPVSNEGTTAKKDQRKMPAPRPVQQRRGQAPLIPSDDEGKHNFYQDNEKEDTEPELSELEGNSNGKDEQDEQEMDDDAGDLFNEESVKVVSQSGYDGHRGRGGRGSQTKDSSPSMDPSTEPLPHSNPSEQRENDSDEDDAVPFAPVTNQARRRAQRLAEELPQIVVNSQLPPSTSTVSSENEYEWLPRTNITLQPFTGATRAFTISLNPQSSHIKSILRAASRHGAIKLLTDCEFCGLETSGLHGLTFASLVHCSDAKGYDGELDISHRLEKGDMAQYILPLVKYAAQRISIDRKTLKTGFSSVILTAFGIDNSAAGTENARKLVMNADYIYPTLPNGSFDYDRPFQHSVISQYLGVAVFGTSKYSRRISAEKTTIFVSSVEEKPLELELPKAMVAMAGCVIHAILKDHSASTDSKFPPPGLQTQWATFIELLDTLEKASKMNYHKFMHKLYLKASKTVAPAAHGLSKEQILKRINFAAFAASGDSDDDGGAPNEASISD